MAQGSYIDVPALQEKNYKKALRKYQGTKGSIIATPYKFLSREDLAALKDRSFMKHVAASWKLLDTATKNLWKSAGNYSMTRGYSLFMQDYCFRRKYGLSLPPVPNQLHQMYGLMMSNPEGIEELRAVRTDIAVTGPITVSFNYKKIEHTPTYGQPFKVTADAVYFHQGDNLHEIQTYEANSGNEDWQSVSFTFGQASRYFFELITSFEASYYDADIIIDNFLITDQTGIVVSEPWKVKANKPWLYQVRTRKQGWDFFPTFGYPFNQLVYTGD